MFQKVEKKGDLGRNCMYQEAPDAFEANLPKLFRMSLKHTDVII